MGNGKKPAVRESVARLVPWIKTRARVVAVDLDGKADLSRLSADYVIVFGGDGTILSVARRLGKNQIPVVGVNFGKFGFLAELSENEFQEVFDTILGGGATPRKRLMLRGCLRRPRRRPQHSLALNDFVVLSRERSRMIALDLAIDRQGATTYEGDGLIVATPVGSTAHSLSAGGPVVHPEVQAFVITPICAHVLSNRSLVVPADGLIEIRVRPGTSGGVVAVDGRTRWDLEPKDVLEIAVFEKAFSLIETGARSYYDTLRSKLNWRGSHSYGPSDSE
ncbi:MAG: NAD(+)/NADH kinase [Planctomycetota bacterium]